MLHTALGVRDVTTEKSKMSTRLVVFVLSVVYERLDYVCSLQMSCRLCHFPPGKCENIMRETIFIEVPCEKYLLTLLVSYWLIG